jgi:hypothetical protein
VINVSDPMGVSEVYQTNNVKVANKLLDHAWLLLDVYHVGELANVESVFVLGKPVSFEAITYSPKKAEDECSPYKEVII